MKAKSKTSKKVAKKPAARKKVTATVKKKKTAPKALKKMAAKKRSAKSAAGKTKKSPVAGKKATSAVKKKKVSVKTVKKSALVKESAAAGTPVVIIEETSVTITATVPADGFPTAPPSALLVGRVTHYYNHSSVAIIEIEAGDLRIGDTIHIQGHTTYFEQMIESMEVEHQPVDLAEAGNAVGVKVRDVVREHDKVYKKIEA